MTGGRVLGGENSPVDVRGRILSARDGVGKEVAILGRTGTKFWREGKMVGGALSTPESGGVEDSLDGAPGWGTLTPGLGGGVGCPGFSRQSGGASGRLGPLLLGLSWLSRVLLT